MIRVFDELRDPWAIALAQITAFFSYFVGAPVWQIVAAAAAVLAARVIAGLTLPLGRPTILPPSILTLKERGVAKLIAEGLTPDVIAIKQKQNPAAVEKTYRSILEKLEFRHPWQVRAWAITVGLIPAPPRPDPIRRIIDSTLVRATLAAGSFIGLYWTLYQIWRTGCPGLRLMWPWFPDCP